METSKLITREDCESALKNVLDTENILISNFSLTPLDAEIYNLKVFFYQDSKLQNMSLFVRTLSKMSKMNTIIDDFKTTVPKFDGEFTLKLLYAKTNVQIFENLVAAGFENGQEFVSFGRQHMECVLEALAQMHAASFAFEDIKTKDLGTKFELDQEYGLVPTNDIFTDLITSEGKTLSEIVKDLEEIQLSQKFRRTFCHGNLIGKNLFFKGEEGLPTKCKIVNFSHGYYGVPICEVLQVVFFNTTEEFRQYHFHALLEHYYDCLEQEMKKYDLDCPNFFPHEQLLIAGHYFLPLIKIEELFVHKKDITDGIHEIWHKSKLISKEDCYLIIRNKLNLAEYKFLSFDVIPLDTVNGFLGEYHKLQIEITDEEDAQTINCFIKRSPQSGMPYEIAQQIQSFSREVFMYETIIPLMKNFDIDTINECLPQCYFHRFEELIVFEDMSLLNYQNVNPLKPLNFELLSLTVKKLARFHACSIILEEKVSERLVDRYEEHFKEQHFFIDENHLGSKMYITGLKSIPSAVEQFPDLATETNRKNFDQFWPQLQELFYTVAKPSEKYKNVLVHGDLWTSNLLVKFDDERPVDCVFVDYQMIRYCPPAFDLLAVFYLTTHPSSRVKYEEELVRIYYQELSSILETYGYSIEVLYPFEDLINSINYMRPQMIVFAAIECMMTMCTSEEIASLLTNEEESRVLYFEDRTDFMKKMCQKSELYRARLRECILDIYEYCNLLSQE